MAFQNESLWIHAATKGIPISPSTRRALIDFPPLLARLWADLSDRHTELGKNDDEHWELFDFIAGDHDQSTVHVE